MEGHGRLVSMGIAVGIMALMLTASLFVTAPSATAALNPSWVTETPMGYNASDAVVVQSGTGPVYVAGGLAYARGNVPASNNMTSYDPISGASTFYTPMPVGVAFAAGAVGPDGLVYVISGYNYSTGLRSDVQIFDPANDSWSTGTPIPSAVLYAKAAVGNDGLIYVLGGWLYPLSVTPQVQIYDPVLDSWSAGPWMPDARMDGVVVERSGYIYYIGGRSTAGGDSLATVFEYGYRWDYWYDGFADLPMGIAHAQGLIGPDGVMYVFGGGRTSPEDLATGFYYDRREYEWMSLPEMSFGASYGGAALASDGRILVLGGSNNTRALDRVESLQVMTESITLSTTSIAEGGQVLVTLSQEFAYLVPTGYHLEVLYESESGVVYLAGEVYSPVGGAFAFEARAPASMPAGNYTLVLYDMWLYSVYQEWNLGAREYAITVLDAATVDEQIAALQTQIAIIQAQLNAMAAGQISAMNDLNETIAALQLQLVSFQEQLDSFQEQVDRVEDKADSGGTYGMITMVLVIIIVLVLVANIMMARRKP